MNVGLPGAGLGNLFFLICALLTIPVELVRTLLGRGSRARWKRAVHHTTLAGSVVAVLAGSYWALQFLLKIGRRRTDASPGRAEPVPGGVESPAGTDVHATGSDAAWLGGSSPFDAIPVAPVLATLALLALLLALTYTLKRITHAPAAARPSRVGVPVAVVERTPSTRSSHTSPQRRRHSRTSRRARPGHIGSRNRPDSRTSQRDATG